MRGRAAAPGTIEAYLAANPPEARRILTRLRRIVREEAPGATERIAYGMPAFELGGPLVYFAAFQGHLGFYALPSGTAAFRAELEPYRSGKGSVQFPLPGEPPWALVRAMVRFRVKENAAKAARKRGPAGPSPKVSRRAGRGPRRAAPRR